MTVIAYKDRTLAGDSAWTDRGTVTRLATKLTVLPSGILYAGAGDGDDRELLELLKGVKTPEDLPPADKLKSTGSLEALLVFPDGQVWEIGTGKRRGYAERRDAPVALGSGALLALGAMLAGAGAEEAATIAASRDIYCREPITTLSLDAKDKDAS